MTDSFGAREMLVVNGRSYEIFALDSLAGQPELSRLPYSLKILLENLLRHEDGISVRADDITALAGWDVQGGESRLLFSSFASILLI